MFHTEYQNDSAIVTDDETPNVRYVVMRDEGTGSPAQWGQFDVYVYRASYRSGTDEGRASESGISAAFFHAYETLDAEQALRAARLYAVTYLDYSPEQAEESIDTYSAGGYSQSDWWDILVINDDRGDSARSSAEVWEQWARGDVWYVFAEQRIECDSSKCHGDDASHWEREPFDHAVLGEIYADDAESAVTEYLLNI